MTPSKAPRGKRTARSRRVARMRLFAYVVLAVAVLFAFAQKVSAEAPKPAFNAKAEARKLVPKAEPPSKDAAKADAGAVGAPRAPGEGAPPSEEAPKSGGTHEGGEDDEETADQLKTAVLVPGKGNVPIHTEGEYRSPFANPKRKQVKAKVGFLLETVEEFDIKKGAFTAHFFVSLTSETPMPKIDLKPTNGKVDEKELLADLPTFKMWKMVGDFHVKPDLHAYPFDTQELVIELEDDSNGQDILRLSTDQEHTFLDTDFSVPGWDTAFIRARILTHYYPDRFENDDLYYSKYKFALGIRRFATSAIFTVFVPALVIVLISLSGLWFPREELEVRAAATTPMLAAAVLFHFALMQELPATAYLSRADKLMMAVYACLFLHMLSSWIWFVVHERHTDRIFQGAKWICGPLTFVIMALGILF